MSSNGTWQTTAWNRSGRCVSAAPTSSPPLLPPLIARRSLRVLPVSISHSAAAVDQQQRDPRAITRWVPVLPYLVARPVESGRQLTLGQHVRATRFGIH